MIIKATGFYQEKVRSNPTDQFNMYTDNYFVDGILDGVPGRYNARKYFGEQYKDKVKDMQLNVEYHCEEKEYQEFKSYKLGKKVEQANNYNTSNTTVTNNSYSDPSYTLAEYDKLFDHAINKASAQAGKATSGKPELFPTVFSSVLGSYFIGAVKQGLKVLNPVQKVEQAVGGQVVNPVATQQVQPQQQTMMDTSPIANDDVPF